MQLSLKEQVHIAINNQRVVHRKKQKDLAEGCGWHPATFNHKWKQNCFSFDDVELLADYLGCDVEFKLVPRNTN